MQADRCVEAGHFFLLNWKPEKYFTNLSELLLLLVGCLLACLTSQQHSSVLQGRICSGNCTRCHTEAKVVDQTFYLTQSQYTDRGSTSPRADPVNARRLAGQPLLTAVLKDLTLKAAHHSVVDLILHIVG